MQQRTRVASVPAGSKFGSWTTTGEVTKKGTHRYVGVKCDCGTESSVRLRLLVIGKATRCRSCARKASEIHGMASHPLHSVWCAMKSRCYNTTNASYSSYGGRGIDVCTDWRTSFVAFYEWAIGNGYRTGLEIDREDNNKGYCPENCRFVDRKTNVRNTRRTAKIKTAYGTKSLAACAEHLGVSFQCIQSRLKRGMTHEDASSKAPWQPRKYEYNGQSMTLGQWAKRMGVSRQCLDNRLRQGWPLSRALSEPSQA